MVNPEFGSVGTTSDPLAYMSTEDGIAFENLTSDPSSQARRVWLRVDQEQLRYYDAGGNLSKVPLQTSQPSGAWLPVTTDSGTTYYIDVEAKISADHPNLAIDGGLGSGLAMTGTITHSNVFEDWEDSITNLEDFESGLSAYSGDTGSFAIVQSPTFEGSDALETATDGGGSNDAITDTDATFRPPTTFRWRQYVPSGTSGPAGFIFAVQSETGESNLSGYQVWLYGDNYNEIAIARYDSGSRVELGNASFSHPDDTWLAAHLFWDTDGTIQFNVGRGDGSDNGGSVITVTDANYTSGGVGWWENDKHNIDALRDTHPLLDWKLSAADAHVITNPVYEGSQAIELAGYDNTIESWNLSNLPQRGDAFRAVWRYPDNVKGAEFRWAAEDFEASHDAANGELRLEGAHISRASAAVSPSANTWYAFDIDYDVSGNNDITLTLRDLDAGSDLAAVTANDGGASNNSGHINCRNSAENSTQGTDHRVIWDVIKPR